MKTLNLVGVLFVAFSDLSVVSVGQWFRQIPLAALGFWNENFRSLLPDP